MTDQLSELIPHSHQTRQTRQNYPSLALIYPLATRSPLASSHARSLTSGPLTPTRPARPCRGLELINLAGLPSSAWPNSRLPSATSTPLGRLADQRRRSTLCIFCLNQSTFARAARPTCCISSARSLARPTRPPLLLPSPPPPLVHCQIASNCQIATGSGAPN